MRKRKPRYSKPAPPTQGELHQLALKQADAAHWQSIFDTFPRELRDAANHNKCGISQIAELLECGAPASDIIAALEAENRRNHS